jgi:hypothetical protein
VWVWAEPGPLAALEAAAKGPTLVPWISEDVRTPHSFQRLKLTLAPSVASPQHRLSKLNSHLVMITEVMLRLWGAWLGWH